MEPQLNKPYMYETTLIIILFIYILVNTIFVVANCDQKTLPGILANLAKIKTDTFLGISGGVDEI